MRLALIQLELHTPGRARNLQAALAAIARAADRDDPPDLILLPDGCDGSALQPVPSDLSPAMGESFAAALGAHAREWGVWIAAGHADVVGARVLRGATLFDPDGDAYLRYIPIAESAAPDVAPGTWAPWAHCVTPLGRLGLATEAGLAAGWPAAAAAARHVDLLLVCGAPRGTGSSAWSRLPYVADAPAEWAARLRAAFCRAASTSGSPVDGAEGGTVAVEHGGRTVARARSGRPDLVLVTMDIPVSPDGGAELSDRGSPAETQE